MEERKNRELDSFDKFSVYEEVEDRGQDALSSRWIMTYKSTETENKVKAWLVARGFEERVKMQADSPTGSTESLPHAADGGCNQQLKDKKWRCEKCLPSGRASGQGGVHGASA